MKREAVQEDISAGSLFETIFLAYYERILALLIRLVGQRSQAEELANEVFCKLYSQPAAVWSNPASWLYRTATNVGIDAIRASSRRTRHEKAASLHLQSSAPGEPDPLHSVLNEEQRRQIRAVLTSMKPAQAQLLLMRAGGSSYKELAEAIGVAPGSIGTLLNRAEAEFRKRYLKLTGQKEVI